jgi:hypothetical protein
MVGNPHTLTQHAVTGACSLAAVHALHTADHVKHVANIAAAMTAFTEIAGWGRAGPQLVNRTPTV